MLFKHTSTHFNLEGNCYIRRVQGLLAPSIKINRIFCNGTQRKNVNHNCNIIIIICWKNVLSKSFNLLAKLSPMELFIQKDNAHLWLISPTFYE